MAGPSSVAADCNTSGNCAKKSKKTKKNNLPYKKPFIDSKVAVQILNLVFLFLLDPTACLLTLTLFPNSAINIFASVLAQILTLNTRALLEGKMICTSVKIIF